MQLLITVEANKLLLLLITAKEQPFLAEHRRIINKSNQIKSHSFLMLELQ